MISWRDPAGKSHTAEANLLNISNSGMAFRCQAEITPQTTVHVRDHSGIGFGDMEVRHSRKEAEDWVMGVERIARQSSPKTMAEPAPNYYEFLQISPTAQAGTIHRVYRYLAGRYHPDNPNTGDPERFLLLNEAYRVLSDPDRRAAYDAELNHGWGEAKSEFRGIDFFDGIEGELNRRLAVLAVLYRKCRENVNDPRVSLIDLEAQMGFPREYLDFTTWYLRSKRYINKEDNSDFSLTAAGVDFIEENFARLPLLRKLLTACTESNSALKRADGFLSGSDNANRGHRRSGKSL